MGLISMCRIWLGMGDISRFASSSVCLKNEQANFSALHYAEPPIRFADTKLRGLDLHSLDNRKTRADTRVFSMTGDEGYQSLCSFLRLLEKKILLVLFLTSLATPNPIGFPSENPGFKPHTAIMKK